MAGSSSRIVSWASRSRDNTVAGPCFQGAKLVNFLQMFISFNQFMYNFELANNGGLLLLLAILQKVGNQIDFLTAAM